MDLLAGLALRKCREEMDRKLSDHGAFQPPRKAPPLPSRGLRAQKEYDRFLTEEDAANHQRQRTRELQLRALVVLGSLLPVLLIVLNWLFFGRPR